MAKLGVFVTAEDLLNAGAPKSAVRQYYRKNDVYTEDQGDCHCDVVYKAEGSARENHFYFLPAKTSAGVDAAKILTVTRVVWGGSIKDSYVEVTVS